MLGIDLDSMFGAWFAGGWIADIVLGVTVAEAALLVGLRHRTGLSVPAVAGLLLPGVFLLLALRVALVLAGVAHLADLRARMKTG